MDLFIMFYFVMLSLNFPLNCNAMLKLSLFNLWFHLYELRIFQSQSFFMHFVTAFCAPPHPASTSAIILLQSILAANSPSGPHRSCPRTFFTDKGAAGLNPRYSRAIQVFEVEVEVSIFHGGMFIYVKVIISLDQKMKMRNKSNNNIKVQ